MPTLEIIITFSILFFLFPNQTSATCHETRCKAKEPWVRFPFQLLREGQDLDCGYDRGFDLSCSNHHKRTILTLPSLRDFIVKDINYIDHIIWIDDPGSCFPKRLMDHDFSLAADSPFSHFYGLENYVFLNCSSREEILAPSPPIDCLSSEDYKVIAVQSIWFYADLNTSSTSSRPLAQTSLSRLCSVISTAMIPLSGSFDGWDLNFGVRLAWDMPDCRLCEASGSLCGFDIATTSQDVVCSGPSNSEQFRRLFPSLNCNIHRRGNACAIVHLRVCNMLFC
ncbi:putative RING-H2 finger protein ATL21A [Rosa sericea]